jgi:hypothetical protein
MNHCKTAAAALLLSLLSLGALAQEEPEKPAPVGPIMVNRPICTVEISGGVVCRGALGSLQELMIRTGANKDQSRCLFACRIEAGIEVCRGKGPQCKVLLDAM